MELKDFIKGVVSDIHDAMDELISEKGLVYDIDDMPNAKNGIHKVIDFDVAVSGSGSVEGKVDGGIKVLDVGVSGATEAKTVHEQTSRVKFKLAFWRKMNEAERTQRNREE